MPFNGSGSFSPPGANYPATTGTTITAANRNAIDADFASGLSNCITKDGQQTVTANIPLGANKITGLGNGTAATDAANLTNLQNATGIYVGTVGGTADVITLTPSPAVTAYAAGQTFRFIASGANTGAVTVNISGLGAKSVTKNGATALAAGEIPSAAIIEITYDGTQFQVGNAYPSWVENGIAGQVAFPATQNASADVNTLDDYEENTWTPALKFGGASVGINEVVTGTYTKVGRKVHVICDVALLDRGSSTGNATIEGLPFASAVGHTMYGRIHWKIMATSFVSCSFSLADSAQTISLFGITTANGSADDNALTHTNFGNSSEIHFEFTYITS